MTSGDCDSIHNSIPPWALPSGAEESLRPALVVAVARHAAHRLRRGYALEVGGFGSLAQALQCVVHGLDSGGERLMPLQRDPHAAACEIVRVLQLPPRTTQHQWHIHS